MRIPPWLDPWRARRELEEDLARELETHLAIARDEQQERGLSATAARQAARKQFGNVTHVREEMREMWGWMWLERVIQDVRYALRTMRKSPGFAAIAVLTLAIGIGANTAIFSVVDHLFFRPFPFRDPDRLAAVHEVVRFGGATRAIPVNLAHFQEWRRSWQSVEDVAVIGGLRMSLTGEGEPERLQTMRVSANLFSLLGVQSRLGRTFAPEEDQLGRDHVVLVSDDLWRRRFNADPFIVGRTIALNDEPYEIVGVLPPFSFPKVSELFPMTIATTSSPQIWKPLGSTPGELEGGGYNFACIARLKPRVAVAQARSTLNALQEALPQRPPGATLQADLLPLTDQVAGRVRSGVTLMWAAVGAVLLIGCVNMANLLLARTLSRRREMAIRTAIGASRGRLVRQVLVESVVMSVMGGIVGVAAAYWVLHVIVSSLPIQRYATPVSRSTFIRTTLERMQALPGVITAGVSNKLPLTGEGGNAALWPERSTAVSNSVVGDVRPVSPDYFRTMGIPWRDGRLFTETDRDRSIAVVSTVAAERLWPGEDPIGRQFHIGARTFPAIQVVGIIGDVRGVSLDRPPSPTVYVPYWQSVIPPGVNSMDLVLVARTTADPMSVSPSLRGLIHDMDPQLALPAFQKMDDVVTDSFGQRRFQMTLVLLFAAAGTLLASLGIYGVVSYSAAQRTNEMGIRVALGALPSDIRRLIIRQGFTPVLIGLGAGVLGSVGVGRVLGTLLFGISSTDPLTLTGVVAVFVTVALAAMYVPAQRAIRVDPVQALRQD